ncbi:hypothetical protein DFH27DRAFT_462838, partial [Peziza echinospora]
LILVGLEAENHGPTTTNQKVFPRAAWLGAAVGLMYSLHLHDSRLQREHLVVGDADTDEKIGRRAWWTLVVMDRWHAIGTSSPLFIPDSSTVLLLEDQSVLGAVPYNIARLSLLLGHLAQCITSAESATATISFASKLLLRGELERFRESVEGFWTSSQHGLIQVAYNHISLLALRFTSMPDPQQLLGPAIHIADALTSTPILLSPLSHHFIVLALSTLADLTEINETKDEARKCIDRLLDTLERRRGNSGQEFSDGWEKALLDTLERRRRMSAGTSGSGADLHPAHVNLQHLAELATHPTMALGNTLRLQRYGYLGSLL